MTYVPPPHYGFTLCCFCVLDLRLVTLLRDVDFANTPYDYTPLLPGMYVYFNLVKDVCLLLLSVVYCYF